MPRTNARAGKKASAKDTPRYPIVQHTFSLIALSPYRFPLDVERLAVHTARVGGLAFVFFGLIFTYGYIERTTSDLIADVAQMATVATASCAPDCDDVLSPTPNVTFAYERTVADAVHVIMNVPKAESVDVYAFEVRTGVYHRLGDATRQTDDSWLYVWDTSEVPPGDYWLKAVVTNRHGTYDRSDNSYFFLE